MSLKKFVRSQVMFKSVIILVILSCVSLINNLTTGLNINWIHLDLDNKVYSTSPIKTLSKIQCVTLASQSPAVTSFSYHRDSKNCYFYTEVPGITLLSISTVLGGAKTYMKFGIPGLLDTTTEPTTTTTTTTPPPTTTTPYQPTVPPLTGEALCASKSGYSYDSASHGCFKIFIFPAQNEPANQTCINDGGYLMRLDNSDKRDWLKSKMFVDSYWLGGQKDSNGDWFWDSGDQIDTSEFPLATQVMLSFVDCVVFTKVILIGSNLDALSCLAIWPFACEIPV